MNFGIIKTFKYKIIPGFNQVYFSDKMEQAIAKIFEGCNSSRINFIARVLKKKNIHTTEDLKTLDSNNWESLIGLTDVEVNKIKEFLERGFEFV